MSLVNKVNRALSASTGFELRRSRSKTRSLWDALLAVHNADFAGEPPEASFMRFCRDNLGRSRAQLFQDLFVLWTTGEKRGGFFVEFGATDGVGLSNSWLLETGYDWRGILAEPARAWHERLSANRGCAIDQRCVSDTSGQTVSFNETPWLELSTIDSFGRDDHHAAARKDGQRYDVATISLNDLLVEHGAPAEIDYLSADTEGSELMILKALDFARFRPRIITVEHNFQSAARTGLHTLLTEQGYRRTFEALSMFDDWYVAS